MALVRWRPGAEDGQVLGVAIIWVALIALWGASERWDVIGAGRRVVGSLHLRERAVDRRDRG